MQERKKATAVGPHSFFADPDPAVFFHADPDVAAFLMRIQIQLKYLSKKLKITFKFSDVAPFTTYTVITYVEYNDTKDAYSLLLVDKKCVMFQMRQPLRRDVLPDI